jgi:hypothetical protein
LVWIFVWQFFDVSFFVWFWDRFWFWDRHWDLYWDRCWDRFWDRHLDLHWDRFWDLFWDLFLGRNFLCGPPAFGLRVYGPAALRAEGLALMNALGRKQFPAFGEVPSSPLRLGLSP